MKWVKQQRTGEIVRKIQAAEDSEGWPFSLDEVRICYAADNRYAILNTYKNDMFSLWLWDSNEEQWTFERDFRRLKNAKQYAEEAQLDSVS